MNAVLPCRRAVPGGWPLLATLGVHLLLAWSWQLAQRPAAPDMQAEHAERVIDLVSLPPPAPVTPRARPLPPPPRVTTSATPRARRDLAPAAPVREPEPITPPPDAAAAVADPLAVTQPPAPPGSPPGALASRALRDAVLVDRELRKGKPGVPEVVDTPMGRFRTALEGAFKDRSRSVTSETYTAPDGQVIYRFRIGDKYVCRTSGSVAPKIGGAEGGGAAMFDTAGGEGRAGSIRCPSHGEWK